MAKNFLGTLAEDVGSLFSRGASSAEKSEAALLAEEEKAVANRAVTAAGSKATSGSPSRATGTYTPASNTFSSYSGPGATRAAIQPINYTPTPIARRTIPSVGTVPVGDVAAGDAAAKKGFLESLGITPGGVGTAALLGGMGLYSGKQAQKAQEQGQAMVGQEKAIAQPYQIQGREMAQQALAGDMTPATQQAYKAAQAQIQQNVATSGGVGQQQAGIQLEAFRQQLLQNQYQYGIQVSQIGDNIALGAIQDSMQLNQNLNAISNSFYSNLGNIAAMSMGNYNPYGMQQPQTITK